MYMSIIPKSFYVGSCHRADNLSAATNFLVKNVELTGYVCPFVDHLRYPQILFIVDHFPYDVLKTCESNVLGLLIVQIVLVEYVIP